MPEENNKQYVTDNNITDIGSFSDRFGKFINSIIGYLNGIFSNLGNVIKIAAFVLAFGIILFSLILAVVLLTKTTFSALTSLAVIILGTIFAGICFFPIYGIGHIVCQNKEILEKLK